MKSQRELLVTRIREGISKPFSEELINLIRPAIRIIPDEHQAQTMTQSKFGGVPLIQEGESWIRTTRGEPYLFLLQVDLEEVKSHDLEKRLPAKGILTVWHSPTYWQDGKVIYYPSTEGLVEADLPPEYYEEQERAQLPSLKRLFTKSNPFKLFPERRIRFETEYHCPSWDSLQMKLFHLKHGTRFHDLEIDEKFIDDYCDEGHADHHLLGYYVGLQESTYELGKVTKGRFPQRFTEDLITDGLQWKVLLQIDSDKMTEMSWADWGKLLFFIKEDDLKQENFKHIMVELDTT